MPNRDYETEQLILAVVRGNPPMTREELLSAMEPVTEWADGIHADQALLRLVVDGDIDIVLPSAIGAELTFKLSAQGRAKAPTK